MGAANTLWVAGFDIIYGSQDYEFDKANGLYSIPVKFGVENALKIAMLFHIITVLCLGMLAVLTPELGPVYLIGLIMIIILFVIEYRLVSPTNLIKVNIASYSVNQLVSIVLLVSGLLDLLIF